MPLILPIFFSVCFIQNDAARGAMVCNEDKAAYLFLFCFLKQLGPHGAAKNCQSFLIV